MKALGLILAFLSASPALADRDGPCANLAKQGAIRAERSGFGAIQGSDGIQYSAKLLGILGNEARYIITISGKNEDGQTWDAEYNVQVLSQGKDCRIQFVKFMGTR